MSKLSDSERGRSENRTLGLRRELMCRERVRWEGREVVS